MAEKSHVGMGLHVRPICLKEHDEVVLLDRHLHNSLPRLSFMGWKLCPEHEAMAAEYVALVEVRSEAHSLEDADRTGNVAHIRRSAWPNIFNVPCPEGPLVFVEVGTIAKLQAIPQQGEGEE